MVALGTNISASWILAANSWMQTPAGVAVHGNHLTVLNWRDVIINPSWLHRLPHMLGDSEIQSIAAIVCASVPKGGDAQETHYFPALTCGKPAVKRVRWKQS
jgi:cytochrome bd-type quinol oxidase subunit 1